MVRRIAIVVWWVGALWFAAGMLGAVLALFLADGNIIANAFAILVLCSLVGVASWTISYILAGSFRRPPATH